MRNYKNRLIALLAVISTFGTSAVLAQNFPTKPITMVLSSGEWVIG